jgi:FkbM family methyltransferase
MNLKTFANRLLPPPVFEFAKRGWHTLRWHVNASYFRLHHPGVRVLRPKTIHAGQLNQPLVVDCLLGKKASGFFLDIGANHPVNNSNTWFFERERGYRGIAFDPLNKYASKWSELRPRTVFMNVAIGAERGRVTFYEGRNEDGWGDQLSYTALASRAGAMEVARETKVEVVPLSAIEGVPATVDFASIDVEGAELQVLAGFGERLRPKVLVVENCFGPVGNRRIREALAGIGYELVARVSYIDDVYVFAGSVDARRELSRLDEDWPEAFA